MMSSSNFKRMNRKGQEQNFLAVIITLFSIAFMTLIGYVFTTEMIGGFVASGLYVGDVAIAGQIFLNTLLIWDKLIALTMVILVIGVGVTSYRLASAPVYFVVTFLLAPLYGLVSYFFNYMFAQIASESVFATAVAYFPITILICTNLHWVMLICIIIGSITLYAKRGDVGQYMT
jgi:hypothetical protein